MMKVDVDEQAVVTDAIVADTLTAYGLTATGWEQVEEGIRNVVIYTTNVKTGDEYFVKFYSATAPHTSDAVEREVAFINGLATYGVPVAEYVERLSGGFVHALPHGGSANYITVTRKIAGSHPARYAPWLIRDLARQHATLHRVGSNYQKERVFKPHEYYHYLAAAPDDTALQELEVTMKPIMARVAEAWPQLPMGLVHLDIDRDNLLAVDERLTGIIDFDDLSLAPLAFCLAGTLWNILESGDSEQDVQAYLQEYEAGRPMTAAEHAILPDMILMRGWVALHEVFFGKGRTSAASERTLQLLAQMCKSGMTLAVPTTVGP